MTCGKAGTTTIKAYTHDHSEVVGSYELTVVEYIPVENVEVNLLKSQERRKKEVTASITENKNKTAQKETETTTNKNTKVYKTIKPKQEQQKNRCRA